MKEKQYFFDKWVEYVRVRWAYSVAWLRAKYARHPKKFIAVVGLGIPLALGFLTVLTLFILVYSQRLGPLPGYPELRAIQNYNASEVYAEDGVLLGKYYIENRINADFEDISPEIIDALIATEDARFFEHRGIDLRATARVLFKSILLSDESSGGGSTLSQQLAKNLYGRREYALFTMPINKMREMIIARRLERTYDKAELLRLYLNTVSFGEGIFGIKVAAQRFFSKAPKDLNIEEAAVLIGMLKATNSYSPVRHPERAVQRRNVVLAQMVRYGYLDTLARDSLVELPLEVKFYKEGNNQGLATYFREYLRQELDDLLKAYPKPDGSPYNLYTDGLRIYTSIDAGLQTYAEEAVQEHMATLQQDFHKDWRKGIPWGSDKTLQRAVEQSDRYQQLKAKGWSEAAIEEVFNQPVSMTIFDWEGEEEQREMSPLDSVKHYLSLLHAGLLAVEPGTGLIKAWVGGIDHENFKYDHIHSRRPVGSIFKPIVFATALQNGMLPCEYTSNERMTYEQYSGWSPRNADGKYGGVYSMEGALSQSVNSVTVEIMLNRAGQDSVRQLARAMGMGPLPRGPAIALGTAESSLYEMAQVYGTLANRGRRPSLHYLDRVETADGQVIVAFDRPDARRFPRVLAQRETDILVKMLEGVVDSGTARRLRYRYGLYNDIAAKTGTTQNHADGWFMGFNPKLVAGAWVGAENPHVHFRSMRYGQAANTALPIWGLFMKKVYQDKNYKSIRYARFPELPDSIAAMLQCPPFFEEMPILADYEEGYFYFEDSRSLIERALDSPYRDEEGRIINVPPRQPDETDEEYAARIMAYQQRLEEREGRREKRKNFWNKLLFNKEAEEAPKEERPTTGYQYDGG